MHRRDIKKCLHNLAVNWQVEIFFTCCTRRKDLNRREHHSIFERFRAQGDGLILCKDGGSHVEPVTGGQWVADMKPVDGPLLGPFSMRSQGAGSPGTRQRRPGFLKLFRSPVQRLEFALQHCRLLLFQLPRGVG